MDIREEFEIWAYSQGVYPKAFPKKDGEPLEYTEYDARLTWSAFQYAFMLGQQLAVNDQAQEAHQTAPQEPIAPVGEAHYMPATDGFTVACFKASDVPAGTKLYKTCPAGEQHHP